jgi:hypothetical protein
LLSQVDQTVADAAGAEFAKWLNWEVLRLSSPFESGKDDSPRRPRYLDFLTTMGVLDNVNSHHVRLQSGPEVLKVIEGFDALDAGIVDVIPVTHVLPQDVTLEYTPDHYKRTSALLQQFMKDVGEPAEISDESADIYGLPPLRTRVPLIAAADSFGAIVAPPMAKTAEGAALIASKVEGARIHLIFNETGFEFLGSSRASGTRFVIAVRPTLRGRYHVWQLDKLKDVISPFAEEQTMTAQSLAFRMSLILESCVPLRSADEIHPVTEKRAELIRSLSAHPPMELLAPLVAGGAVG